MRKKKGSIRIVFEKEEITTIKTRGYIEVDESVSNQEAIKLIEEFTGCDTVKIKNTLNP